MTSASKSGNRTWLWIALGGGGLLAAFCACVALIALVFVLRGGADIFSGGSATTTQIGPEGGEVSAAGARLIFPAGSVDTSVEVRLAEATDPPTIPPEYLVSAAGRA